MNKRIAIFGKAFDPIHSDQMQNLIMLLHEAGVKITIFDGLYRRIKAHVHLSASVERFRFHKEIVGKVDYLLSIGGDGTLLDTIMLVRDSGIPVLGINFGNLGFLSSIHRDEIKPAIANLIQGEFNIEKRDLLRLSTRDQLFGDLNYAMNELSIVKNYPASMLMISAWVDDVYLTTYWADGLNISTPTGSTAYNMSCGGPILTPDSQNFIITPIANHNLSVRPIVIPNTHTIRIKVEGRIQNFIVTLDSRSEHISQSLELFVTKEEFSVNLIRMKNEDFYATIRNKLNWGIDKRN